ncbi:SHOCT domain-containing protein [Terrabacter sp. Ter38]|uniref:SHOCT domain-containing protein n=1 Tax=Terrabacter sp. Ter38 TaxID=2926030 RepID=UPI0021191B9C|nr:SHOCT domain-containing protein [Terrabacter sp. Ter38]
MRGRRGRPGLLGVAARTAVVAGTATAVSGKVAQGQQAKAQQAADAQAQQQQEAAAQAAATEAQAPPPPPPPPPPPAPVPAADDVLDSLERLAALHAQGILTDEELAQQKARILGG